MNGFGAVGPISFGSRISVSSAIMTAEQRCSARHTHMPQQEGRRGSFGGLAAPAPATACQREKGDTATTEPKRKRRELAVREHTRRIHFA
jgi:hypothetical protein